MQPDIQKALPADTTCQDMAQPDSALTEIQVIKNSHGQCRQVKATE